MVGVTLVTVCPVAGPSARRSLYYDTLLRLLFAGITFAAGRDYRWTLQALPSAVVVHHFRGHVLGKA